MSVTISSKRYAQAAFQIAIERNELRKWHSDLRKVAGLMENPEFAIVAENPKLPFEVKAKLTRESLGKINPLALNLAYILIAKSKSRSASQIAEEYDHLVDDYHGIKRAEVTTVIPLDDSEKKKLGQRLEAIIGSKVNMEFTIDHSILGGFIIRVNGMLIDGSVRNKLELLKKNIVGTRK